MNVPRMTHHATSSNVVHGATAAALSATIRFARASLLLLPLSILVGCASNAPFTWKERRDLSWQASVIKANFRAAQALADASQQQGTLLIMQRNDIAARSRVTPRLAAARTPASALHAMPRDERNSLTRNGVCVWITRSGVAAVPLQVPCADELEKAELIAQAEDLTHRARGLAVEFDHFKQSAVFLTEGLANTLALAKLTEARMTNSEESLAIVTESSTKANQTLLSVVDASRNTVVALKSANDELARRIDELTAKLNTLK